MLTDLCFKCSNKDSILCTICGIAKDGAREHFKQKPLTNADRIRAMSDEELAVFVSDLGCHPSHEVCYRFWLNWLKQEEGDDD